MATAPPFDKMEPAASEHAAFIAELEPRASVIAAVSSAISLKRIADALTGAGPSMLSQPLNNYGEGIGECIQGQFERSQR